MVVSSPSGAGKTTICRALVTQMAEADYAISLTTRSPRPGEVDGSDYHFVTRDEFEKRIRERRLVEWAEVHGNLYGTDRNTLEEQMVAGRIVLLDLDVQGARQLKTAVPETVMVFICPPSWEALESRLRMRGADDEETVALRLANAREEMSHHKNYDYVVLNDDLARATHRVGEIIRGESSRTGRTRLDGWDEGP